MSKEVSETVFNLIKVMNQPEKRHFKIFASRHTGNKGNLYTKLFNIIEAQKTYNELKITSKLKLTKSQIADSKKYLRILILKSLRTFSAKNSIELELKELLSYVIILFEKGLSEECIPILNKAKKIADIYEMQVYLYEISIWQQRIMQSGLTIIYDDESYKTPLKYAENLKNEVAFRTAEIKMTQKQWMIRGGKKNEINKLQKIVTSIHKLKPETFSSIMYYYSLMGIYYRTKGNLKRSSEFYAKMLKHLSDNDHQKNLIPRSYLGAFVNLFNFFDENKDFDEAFKTIGLMQYHGSSERIKSEYITMALHLKLIYAINTVNLNYGNEVMKEIRQTLSSKNLRVDESFEIQHYIGFASLLFIGKKYREALKELSVFLNWPQAKNSAHYSLCRIFNLVIHYELGNIDLLGYETRSLYKYLLKSRSLSQFENMTISFITKTINIRSEKKMLESFKLLYHELQRIKKNPEERFAIEYFNFDSWLQSKIENKNLVDVLRNS